LKSQALAKPDAQARQTIPTVAATPISGRRVDSTHNVSAKSRPSATAAEAPIVGFLNSLRVLVGVARLYQRNHPRLMEIVQRTERQLRLALATESPLELIVERHGLALPKRDATHEQPLADPRGELRAFAEELLRSGITSLRFTSQTNVGELDQFAHQVSQVPRATTPGDTASRKAWDNWLADQQIAGITLNVPLERRDSTLLASLVSAVLGYDDSPGRSPQARAAAKLPPATFENMAATLRLLTNLAPAADRDPEAAADDFARQVHAALAAAEPAAVALIVHGVSHMTPRPAENLPAYLARMADALILDFVRQEFESGRVTPPEVLQLLAKIEQDRGETPAGERFTGVAGRNEAHVAELCDRFWMRIPAREKARWLRSTAAWCVPAGVVARYLEPLANAAETRNAEAAGREARTVLLAYAKCLESPESKTRRVVAAGQAELASQIERLWPHPSAAEFGRGIVRALVMETSAGVAGLLSALTENLARIALTRHAHIEFEQMLETLETAPHDDEHAHITTLVSRILNGDSWLYLVDEALSNKPLPPVIPRLMQRNPERLLDRLTLLLTTPEGRTSIAAMVRLVRATGEKTLATLENRLREPRRQRIAAAIHLLAAADPRRLAAALPRALPSWEWSLQDLAVSELSRWTLPAVSRAVTRAFLAVVAEAHHLVVPCIIDHLGVEQEFSAVPLLLKVAGGEYAGLRDIYFRIKAVEALGRMRVTDAGPVLRRIVHERNGLTHAEPAGLRAAAEEALALLENRPASVRVRIAEERLAKSAVAYARPRRYLRVPLESPLSAVLAGPKESAARVRSISLGGACLEGERKLAVGESVRVEIRAGLRRIHSTAVVRNINNEGTGVEFVHMHEDDRERLRRLVTRMLR